MSTPIQENDRRIQFIATGGQVQFDADFLIFNETDITVLRTDNSVSPAVTTTLVLNTDYTVSGLAVLTGFTILLDTTAFPTGAQAGDFFTVFGDIPIQRLTDFQVAGAFNAVTINAELDSITQILQELNTKLVRTLQLFEEDDAVVEDNRLPLDRALKFLSFDANKKPVAVETIAGTVAVSSFWQSILSFTDFPTSGIAALALVNAWTRAQGFTPVALTAAATVTWDGDTQQNATLTPDQDFTLANITGARAGFTYTLVITNDNPTPRVITFDTNYQSPGGTLPVLTAAADAVDLLTVYAKSATELVVTAGLNIS